MMNITSLAGVEAFMDKFHDPTFEVSRILQALDIEETEVSAAFIHKLLMKAYRLGKEHGYVASMQAARKKK